MSPFACFLTIGSDIWPVHSPLFPNTFPMIDIRNCSGHILPLSPDMASPFSKKKMSFIFGFAGSPCCAQIFSSCGEQGLLSRCSARAAHHSGFSCCRAWA